MRGRIAEGRRRQTGGPFCCVGFWKSDFRAPKLGAISGPLRGAIGGIIFCLCLCLCLGLFLAYLAYVWLMVKNGIFTQKTKTIGLSVAFYGVQRKPPVIKT